MPPITLTVLKRSLKLSQIPASSIEVGLNPKRETKLPKSRSLDGVNLSESETSKLMGDSTWNLNLTQNSAHKSMLCLFKNSNLIRRSTIYSSLTQNSRLYSSSAQNSSQSSHFYSISAQNSPVHSNAVENSSNEDLNQIILSYLDGKDNGIAVLGLNRPSKRNALGKTLLSQLKSALSSIRSDSKVRVLVIRSLVPKVFCAGADLRERSRMTPEEVEDFVRALRATMSEIEALPTPVISAIDGAAIGGGFEMALASDVRVASKAARMGLVETKLAIIPGAGGTQRLPRIIGPAKAKELIFTGRMVEGEEAEKIGMVNKLVEENKKGDAAYEEALGIAREILENGPIGVQMAKVAITRGLRTDIENGLEIEEQCYKRVINSRDRIEGLAAFAAKRKPIYKGI